jgi:hypothetical protein
MVCEELPLRLEGTPVPLLTGVGLLLPLPDAAPGDSSSSTLSFAGLGLLKQAGPLKVGVVRCLSQQSLQRVVALRLCQWGPLSEVVP